VRGVAVLFYVFWEGAGCVHSSDYIDQEECQTVLSFDASFVALIQVLAFGLSLTALFGK